MDDDASFTPGMSTSSGSDVGSFNSGPANPDSSEGADASGAGIANINPNLSSLQFNSASMGGGKKSSAPARPNVKPIAYPYNGRSVFGDLGSIAEDL